MKRILLAAAIAGTLLTGSAFAHGSKGHGHGHGKHHATHYQGHDRDARFDGHHDNGLHLGQYKHWARGDRLPDTYLASRYYVTDYRTYRLAPPPRGYVWVRPYPDAREYYLVQAATGLIQQIFGL